MEKVNKWCGNLSGELREGQKWYPTGPLFAGRGVQTYGLTPTIFGWGHAQSLIMLK
ncbi:MAG TPA: hypothetical protein VF691_09155 [Cytophagaceae bacterium]